ncbi:gag protein [Thermus hydrothermalis]|uniref:gag protein n=1 Tax=Thermus hydrothermalis TaxID=2908148 RepID=UPI001FAAEC2E|nr:gag protein [Thermus hydrothermalis]
MKRPFRSVLDTIRGHGLTPAELRQRARLAERHGQAFLAQLYLDEAEAQEVALRVAHPCALCGDTGRIADDIPCWRCHPELAGRKVREVRRGA